MTKTESIEVILNEMSSSLDHIAGNISDVTRDPLVDQMGNNMPDCISNVAYQLERIADQLEKQNQAG
mgnify:CR=1 FL=1